MALVVKNPPANEGDMGSIPGLRRSLGGGHSNALQHSCLEISMDRESMGSQDPEKPSVTNRSLQCDYENVPKGC